MYIGGFVSGRNTLGQTLPLTIVRPHPDIDSQRFEQARCVVIQTCTGD